MRVLVVDDEAPGRQRLIRLLVELGEEVVGEASDGGEALAAIRTLRPDVVLLDIRMPEIDGLSLASLPDLPPIVFTTAHAEHAVDAFERAATDYLLKPVRIERLAEALRRVRARIPLQRLAARAGGTTRLFDPATIGRIRATDKVAVFERDGVEHVLDESLAELERRLPGFARAHRAELVNLEHVVAVHREAGLVALELLDGARVTVSRRRWPAIEARLGLAPRKGSV